MFLFEITPGLIICSESNRVLKVSYHAIFRHILWVSDIYKYIKTCLWCVLLKIPNRSCILEIPHIPLFQLLEKSKFGSLAWTKKKEVDLMPAQNSTSRNSAKCCRDETPYHVPNHIKDSLWNSMELKLFLSLRFTTRWVPFYFLLLHTCSLQYRLALSVSHANVNTDHITSRTRLIVSDSNVSDWPVGVKPAHILVMPSWRSKSGSAPLFARF